MLILKYVGVRRNPFLIVNGKQWDVYYSSQWFCLTGKCAAYVLEQLKNNKDKSDLKSCSISHYINYTDHIWAYDEHDYDSLMQ